MFDYSITSTADNHSFNSENLLSIKNQSIESTVVKFLQWLKSASATLGYLRQMKILNHDKFLQIYFICIMRQTKKDFLKDVKSKVVIVCSFCNLADLGLVCVQNSQWDVS